MQLVSGREIMKLHFISMLCVIKDVSNSEDDKESTLQRIDKFPRNTEFTSNRTISQPITRLTIKNMIGREDVGIQISHSNHANINFTYNALCTCIYARCAPQFVIYRLPRTLLYLNSIYNFV